MLWLIIAISAYFLFAIVVLGDKYLLSGLPNPKSYSFYVGVLGILVLFLIPFVGFSIPEISQILLSLLAGAVFIFALFGLYTGLENFEASRIVPAIGGLLPLFTFGLVYLFSCGKEVLTFGDLPAFILLIFGSCLITFKKGKSITSKSLKLSVITALLFALAFVLAKFVYLSQPFWSGFIWMRIGGFLAAICFIFTREVKKEIFERKFTFQKKTGTFFLLNQTMAAGAFILQNWAIALAPLGFLAFINALEGTKYVFLLIFTTSLSLAQPLWVKKVGLKEEISRKILFQKIMAILLIGGGLALLAL
jgi:drug/metabolite transporter (DMT)-like permease